jgi:hypothetical protein
MSNLANITIGFTFATDPAPTNKVNAGQLDTQLAALATAQNQTKAALDSITDSANNLAAATVGFSQLKPEVTSAMAVVTGITGTAVLNAIPVWSNAATLVTSGLNLDYSASTTTIGFTPSADGTQFDGDVWFGLAGPRYQANGVKYTVAAREGNATGLSPSAGQVGELIEAKTSTATNAAATGTYLALASITLTAGNWWISAIANEEPGTGATTTAGGALEALVGTTTASATGATRGYDWVKISHALALADSNSLTVPCKRVSITTPTTYYLNVLQTYSAGVPQWRGMLSATRMP